MLVTRNDRGHINARSGERVWEQSGQGSMAYVSPGHTVVTSEEHHNIWAYVLQAEWGP